MFKIPKILIVAFLLFDCSAEENIQTPDQNVSTLEQSPINIKYYDFQKEANDFITDNTSDTLTYYIDQIDVKECVSIDVELRKVYKNDQQYRDSIHSPLNDNPEKARYFRQMMKKNDRVNEMIVRHILGAVGWTDSCSLNDEAHLGIWHTILHSNNVDFKAENLKYVETAFKDSILSATEYAYIIDDIYVKSGKKQKYGTFSRIGKKLTREVNKRVSSGIDSINLERKLIGLERIE